MIKCHPNVICMTNHYADISMTKHHTNIRCHKDIIWMTKLYKNISMQNAMIDQM